MNAGAWKNPFWTCVLVSPTFSPREQEVFGFVTTGLMNKQIAAELGVSKITVKVHRGNAMKKMGARSLADLARITNALGVQEAKH
jgi:FixJ family two-component response regulator